MRKKRWLDEKERRGVGSCEEPTRADFGFGAENSLPPSEVGGAVYIHYKQQRRSAGRSSMTGRPWMNSINMYNRFWSLNV
jgi:hypothetical protein